MKFLAISTILSVCVASAMGGSSSYPSTYFTSSSDTTSITSSPETSSYSESSTPPQCSKFNFSLLNCQVFKLKIKNRPQRGLKNSPRIQIFASKFFIQVSCSSFSSKFLVQVSQFSSFPQRFSGDLSTSTWSTFQFPTQKLSTLSELS